MKRLSIAVLGALFLCAAALAPSQAADANGIIAAFQGAWSRVNDYTCNIESNVTKDGRSEQRTYIFWFKKPSWIRTDVVSGTRAGDPGSVAIYNGSGKVQGHQGGMLSGIVLSLPVDDAKCTSIRGGRITDLPFTKQAELIRKYQNARAKIEVGATTTVNGHAATPLTLFTHNPAFILVNENIAKDVIFFDNQTSLPLEWDRYEADGQHVVKMYFTNLRTNVNIPDGAFDPKAATPKI